MGTVSDRFRYHPPSSRRIQTKHEIVREELERTARTLLSVMEGDPSGDQQPSRELSSFLTSLEEAMFWANAHIARNMNYQENAGVGMSPVQGKDDPNREQY